jgi:hypothetical protein
MADLVHNFEGWQAPLLFVAIVVVESDLGIIAGHIPHAQFVHIIVATDIPPVFIPDVTAVVDRGIQ